MCLGLSERETEREERGRLFWPALAFFQNLAVFTSTFRPVISPTHVDSDRLASPPLPANRLRLLCAPLLGSSTHLKFEGSGETRSRFSRHGATTVAGAPGAPPPSSPSPADAADANAPDAASAFILAAAALSITREYSPARLRDAPGAADATE